MFCISAMSQFPSPLPYASCLKPNSIATSNTLKYRGDFQEKINGHRDSSDSTTILFGFSFKPQYERNATIAALGFANRFCIAGNIARNWFQKPATQKQELALHAINPVVTTTSSTDSVKCPTKCM